MRNTRLLMNSLWVLVAVYTVARLAYTLFSLSIPGTTLLLLSVVFALVHGALRYGWRGMVTFVVICLVVSNALENTSILTGFPFGHYYYTDALGPKLFLVPLLIGGAYTGAGYLSWIVAHVLLDRTGASNRFAVWALPVVGALLMVSWDLSLD